MIYCVNTYSQQSFDIYGGLETKGFRLNSFEANPGNVTSTKDWEISFVFGGTVSGSSSELTSDIYMISLAKRIGAHYIYTRYTPGFKSEFLFNSGNTLSADSSVKVLNTNITYEENFGLGYSYNLSNNLSAGFTLRYFQQTLMNDQVNLFISDTMNTIITTTAEYKKKFWRGDAALSYAFDEHVNASLFSINLFILNENGNFEDAENLEMKIEKGALLEIHYHPAKDFQLTLNYETKGSFGFGTGYSFNLLGGFFRAGISAYHDRIQDPYLCSLVPSLNFSSELLSISLVGVKYLSDRTNAKPLSELTNNGLSNILHNQFSTDKLLLSFNLALSFKQTQQVKFIDAEIIDEIFPTLSEEYLIKPFAVGKVANLTNTIVNVKPASYISEFNNERVFSPSVLIAPNDTIEIPFYTVINKTGFIAVKRKISQVELFLLSDNSDDEDYLQKPVLINDFNSWNGMITNLRYFVKSDYQFSNTFAKNLLQQEKEILEESSPEINTFMRIKILFDKFAASIVYVSDPRSSVEYVQFPRETIERKGGDCDDLSVAFSSLLESVGIQTAFVDYRADDGVSHVNLLINTGLSPEQAGLITNNDKKYFIRANNKMIDEVWIPLETTSLATFENAWTMGADKFNEEAIDELGLMKGKVEIIDIY